jgi:DNA-damage-inducible protein D
MACESAGVEPEDQFRQMTEKVSIGSGAERDRGDWFLTRYACYLIAMNADPSKPQVGFAQTYFAVQTRKREIDERLSGIERRIEQRHRVTQTVKALNSAAKSAGVQKYALFQDAGYRGLYDMGLADIKRRKGLSAREDLLDRAGRAELAAIEFKNTQTEQKLIREKIVGEARAIQTHRSVASEVRKTIQTLGGTLPENLRPEESIKKIESARKKKPSVRAIEEHPKALANVEPIKAPETIEMVAGCSECEKGSPVRHFGSVGCKSGSLASGGTRAHCTCDTCF